MISTILDYESLGTRIYEFRGLSTDTKPLENVPNGSVFLEMDTGNVFMFDQVSESWKAL